MMHDAMHILNNIDLSINDVAHAYEILIDASSTVSNEIILMKHATGYHNNHHHQDNDNNPDEVKSQKMNQNNIFDSIDLILLSDIYRCLIISCQLLLEMNLSNRSIDSSSSSKQAISLKENDINILKQTMRRCIILLKVISLMFQLTIGATKSDFKLELLVENNNNKWYLHHLPKSNHDLINECFDGPEPIICLDELNDYDYNSVYEEDVPSSSSLYVNEEYTNNINNRNEIDCCINNGRDVDNVMDSNKNNMEDDEIMLNIDPKQLEKEESELLQIAFPNGINDNQQSFTNDDNHIKNINNHNITTTNKMKPIVIKGWLIKVAEDDNNTISTTATTTVPKYCQLYSNGIFSINNNNNNNDNEIIRDTSIEETTSSSFSIIYLNEKTICKPIVHDKIFYFSIENYHGTDDLSFPDNDETAIENQHYRHQYPNVLFQMDESDGGFMKGFSWVSAINNVIMSSSVRRRIQDEFFEEWNMNTTNTDLS